MEGLLRLILRSCGWGGESGKSQEHAVVVSGRLWGVQHAPSACWFGGVSSRGTMAALASSLIRQKREVREPGGSRPVSAQRRVCPRGTKSLCQKQLLILLSKVRLCGGRSGRPDRGPGEWLKRGLRNWGLCLGG